MTKSIINYALLFLVLVLVQVVIFNNLILWDVAIPMVFIYLIIRLPLSFNVSWMLTVSFLMGLVIDIFSDTPGINAMSCTVLAMVKRPVSLLYVQRDDDFASLPLTIRTLGALTYLKLALTLTFIYCSLVILVDAFNFFHPLLMLERICASTIYTFIIIYAIDNLKIGKQ